MQSSFEVWIFCSSTVLCRILLTAGGQHTCAFEHSCGIQIAQLRVNLQLILQDIAGGSYGLCTEAHQLMPMDYTSLVLSCVMARNQHSQVFVLGFELCVILFDCCSWQGVMCNCLCV